MPDFKLEVRLNAGDVQHIQAKLIGAKGRINAGLWARARNLGSIGVEMLNAECPQGTDGNWADGQPKLNTSHRATILNPYYAELYSVAEHAKFIVFGTEPHMPPEEAWTGEPSASVPARMSVLDHGTPAQDDYFSRVEAKLEPLNAISAETIGSTIWI